MQDADKSTTKSGGMQAQIDGRALRSDATTLLGWPLAIAALAGSALAWRSGWR